MKREDLARRALELGIPRAMLRGVRYQRHDRGGGWELEWIGAPIESPPAPGPYHHWRDRRTGEIVASHRVWYQAARHVPTGFRLERRWHPDSGHEWTAVSRDGEFALLRQARREFQQRGRPRKLHGPEEIRSTYGKLRLAAGRPPSAARLARELDIRVETLRRYLSKWGVELEGIRSTQKV